MKLAVLKETTEHERRVAASPETVKKFRDLGFTVTVEAGAGIKASFLDTSYEDAGAVLAGTPQAAVQNADITLCVQAPTDDILTSLPRGSALVGLLSPHTCAPSRYAAQNLTAFAMELVPRITRAQAMDVLSSQSNLAGYKAVLDAAEYYPHALPLMMTAAGTVPAAKVFVMGAGVAGLQAIATAKRLGAVVSATDVRPAAKEQVESLGGKFVMVEDEETKAAETAGGYAKEMSEDYKKKQAALIAQTIPKQDIIITTALIPGRAAPVLVTGDMVRAMKPGSVIVDLAVEQGGNVEGSKAGEIVDINGVKIVGHINVPSRLAADASALYARNLLNFVKTYVSDDKTLHFDWNDDIIQGCALTRDGNVVHEKFKD